MTRRKKVIYDKLKTDLAALKYYNDNTCFADVQGIYIDFPEGTPFLQIYPTAPQIEIDGIDFDNRTYGFALIVGDLISKEASQTEINNQMDRLADIEDSILDYLEQIPNNFSGLAAGVRPYRVDIQGSSYLFEEAPDGIRVYMTIDIALILSISVKSLP